LELLKLSGDAARDLSWVIDKIAAGAARDSKEHDATVALGESRGGITIHCNDLPDVIAASKLRRHCELRKHSQRAATWFGIAITPGNATLRFGVMLDYAWRADRDLDNIVAKMPKARPMADLRRARMAQSRSGNKIGVNDPCPCGSGRKYKRCHGRR
jgi:hypothetical protein